METFRLLKYLSISSPSWILFSTIQSFQSSISFIKPFNILYNLHSTNSFDFICLLIWLISYYSSAVGLLTVLGAIWKK